MNTAATAPPPLVFVVEDEPEIARLITSALQAHGMRCEWFHDGAALMRHLAAEQPDACVLDLGLPDMDGMALLRHIAERYACGVLIVTGRDHTADRVMGLEQGADDYVLKPFEPRELVARLQTVLRRRRGGGSDGRLRFEGLVIDPLTRTALRHGESLDLTGTEFDLLLLLAREPGKVFSRDDILNRLRGHEAELFTRAVDIVVSRLRRKLEPLAAIKTLRNAGYALALRPEGAPGA